MFLVEFHKDLGVDAKSGLGHHARMLYYFSTLKDAIDYRKDLKPVERTGAQTREATHDDFWELAQAYFVRAADYCAQKDYKRATFWSARANAFTELAAGRVSVEELESKYSELLYSMEYEPEEGDSHAT